MSEFRKGFERKYLRTATAAILAVALLAIACTSAKPTVESTAVPEPTWTPTASLSDSFELSYGVEASQLCINNPKLPNIMVGIGLSEVQSDGSLQEIIAETLPLHVRTNNIDANVINSPSIEPPNNLPDNRLAMRYINIDCKGIGESKISLSMDLGRLTCEDQSNSEKAYLTYIDAYYNTVDDRTIMVDVKNVQTILNNRKIEIFGNGQSIVDSSKNGTTVYTRTPDLQNAVVDLNPRYKLRRDIGRRSIGIKCK